MEMKPCFTQSMRFLLLLAFQTLTAGYRVETIPGFLQPVVGAWHRNVTLPCHIEPQLSAVGLQVRWFREGSEQPVHLHRYGRDDPALQDGAYQGRTRLFEEELASGNVSLRLSDLQLSDSGVYRCLVQGDRWEDERNVTLLIPVSGSQPRVSVDRTGRPRLVCRSEGWFPQPEVTWRDKRGGVATPHTRHSQDEQGLYTVISDLELQRQSDVFSCMVTAEGPGGASKLHIAEDFYPPMSSWMMLFFLMVGFVSIFIPVVIRAWRRLNVRYKNACNSVTVRLGKELAALKQPIKSEWSSIRGYAATVTLDPCTAYNRLVLSADRKQVYMAEKRLKLPVDARRFKHFPYVLGKESFSSGSHYWEVEVGRKPWWCVGVCRMFVNRSREMETTPSHGYWTLELRGEETCRGGGASLHVRRRPHKVGVYLNYEDGQVSFYNAETTSLIHTLSDHFTEALCPFFCTGVIGGNIPLIICPIEAGTSP
ncbi:butyrophilin subfamily 1 member A1-like [Conger conger]|uniref:butyrophilin subfamily 1 member A1-like n=1 Tax=Conger conger TaxID=82655 RepID=UPI002A5A8106|nr:butyrophilin subfamily 1 member A1-like [Conger conger]